MNPAVAESPLRGRTIFVVGAQRSGTNWIQRILAAHPDVASMPTETHLFQWLKQLSIHIRHGAAGSLTIGQVYMDRAQYLAAMRRFCDAIFVNNLEILDGRADRLVERSPQHAHQLDLIAAVYPDASVVHIIRDGRDVVRSILNQRFGPEDAHDAAVEWRASIDDARRSAGEVERYAEVRYEALLRDPAGEIGTLYEALGLRSSPDIVAAAVRESEIPYNVDPGMPQIGAGKWRQGLTEADVATISAVAGPMLTALGYTDAEADAAEVPQLPEPPASPASPAAPASLAARARAKARAVVARKGSRDPDQNLIRAITWLQEESLAVAESFLEALAAGRTAEVADLLADDASVRIQRQGDTWEGHGPEAAPALTETFVKNLPSTARQTAGDVHPGVPTVTAVIDYDLGNGSRGTRVLVLVVARTAISKVTLYWRHWRRDQP
jgi:sulfotransferase family protein